MAAKASAGLGGLGLRGAGWLRAPRSCPGISAALGVAGAEDSSEGRFNPVLSYCAWTLRVLSECRPGCRSSRSTGNESKGKWSYGLGEGFMASGARVSFFFFLAVLGFSVILFGYIKYFRRLSWSLICWEVGNVMRGEVIARAGSGALPLARSSHFCRPCLARDRRAARTAGLRSALGSSAAPHSLRQVWEAESCFQTAGDGHSQPSWAWTCVWRGRCQWGTVQAAFVRRGFHTNVLWSYALTYK